MLNTTSPVATPPARLGADQLTLEHVPSASTGAALTNRGLAPSLGSFMHESDCSCAVETCITAASYRMIMLPSSSVASPSTTVARPVQDRVSDPPRRGTPTNGVLRLLLASCGRDDLPVGVRVEDREVGRFARRDRAAVRSATPAIAAGLHDMRRDDVGDSACRGAPG